jgi:hypothetical protein
MGKAVGGWVAMVGACSAASDDAVGATVWQGVCVCGGGLDLVAWLVVGTSMRGIGLTLYRMA